MLGYFRREEKSAWWEHFRLRDMDADGLLDEREALGGLEFIEELPKAGRQRNSRVRFSFPPQETAVREGDTLYSTSTDDPEPDGPGTRAGSVVEVDLDASTILLSISASFAGRHLGAVFRNQVVGAKELEASLLALGRHVTDSGYAVGGSFGAASDLLLRQLPRRRADSDRVLGQPGETTVDATIRLCRELDGGVLPIQGPPGAGKTYTGARAILRLATSGYRVGVTAVSHKVIDNLLSEVGVAARECGVAVRLVHKDEEGPAQGIEYIQSPATALRAVAPGCVVGGTAWLWAGDDAANTLDYLFVDEAGQMALAQVLAASRAPRNLILLGDPQQLEQPKRGAHPDGAEIAALVHLIGHEQSTLREDQGVFLDTTYRLHPALCRFTSESYYEGKLRAAQGLENQQLGGPTPFAGAGLFLVECEHAGNQAIAPEEIDAVEHIVHSLLSPGVAWTDRQGKTRPVAPGDILVVAPYNAQRSALLHRLQATGVTRVGTVDKFQGQEAPIVVYSCTSSSPQDAPRGMDFLYDPHRWNVATSRAQGVVIVVASPRLFEPECRTPQQMRMANGFCRYREMAHRVCAEGAPWTPQEA